MFEESGGNDKKRKWIMIGVGTAIIAIFLLIRNSMNARVQQAAADQTAAAVAPAPTITDQGSYPDMMTGGISGTGMDQTMATYLAIADQNTSVQMGAVSDALTAIHDQMNTNNTALQAQIILQIQIELKPDKPFRSLQKFKNEYSCRHISSAKNKNAQKPENMQKIFRSKKDLLSI